jgi:sulfofructose kinase
MPRILCAGLIAVDLLFDVATHPEKGSKNRATGSRMIGGGGARNAAVAIARLGGQASLAGAIGADALGVFIQETLSDHGVESDYLRVLPGVRTANSAILIAPDGDRTIINHREDMLFDGGVTLPDRFPFDAVLTDTRWPQGAADLMQAARRAGKPGVMDAEAPVLHARQALESASHVIFSEQGLRDYVGACDGAALAEAAKRLTPRTPDVWVAVTRGPLPVLCHDGRFLSEVPGFPVRAVDTLGAGDVWHGAFTLALARGMSAQQAVRWANAAGALKVSRAPDQPPLPDAEEVEDLLARP